MLGTEIISWKRLSRRTRKPVHLILFITDHCNAKCGTCFYWQSLNQGESLKLDQVEKISHSMDEMVWLDLSGGEPFLRRDIDKICHQFVDRNRVRHINIPTNAIQTGVIANSVEAILANRAAFRVNVAISLDGIGETHDRIRGVPGNYTKALATMRALQEIRARDSRLALSVVTTLMRNNVADVRKLLEIGLSEWKLDYHSINILRGAWMDPSLQPPTPEQYAEISELQLQQCRHYFRGRWGLFSGMIATMGRTVLNNYYMRDMQGQPKDIRCNAGDVSCVIDANCDVYFCELLKPIGNLKTYDWDFDRLWTDFEATLLRQKVQAGCHCTHECFHTKNLIFSPWRLM
jgi:MoaA/NifB/PqqE/SkfB family radical SAM enzyme